MTRKRLVEALDAGVREHPAVEAWSRLCPDGSEPRRVSMLKPPRKRSAVYRLEGAGPGQSSVVAKRGRATRVSTELFVYREILPLTPAPTLQCYGSVEDQEPGFAWLFVEDAGEERYSASNTDHRALAGRWLGLLHASIAAPSALASCLPGRGVDYYRSIVALARDTIRRSVPNPAFSRADVATLEGILAACAVLESHWAAIEEICSRVPHTLVHGDFGAKNVRVRVGQSGLEVLPLDWDSAGWGVAATDLSQSDVAMYWSVVRHTWPELEPDVLSQLATIGAMFLALESITGEAEALAGSWIDDVMRKMRAYESELTRASRNMAWGSW